jgi:hypothetical protein
MRRAYISPEFNYSGQFGTKNMIEETSFFGSKMLYIQDYISVTNQNIVYYQTKDNEQLDFVLEKNISPIVYSSIQDKKNNHTLILDPAQSDSQKNSNAKWNVKINLQSILSDYIFATLKHYRTFEGTKNSMTSYNDINSSIKEYISKNVLNRYGFSTIEFYIQYQSFSETGTLRFDNTFTEINNSAYFIKQLQASLDDKQKVLNVTFNQANDSKLYNFNYYYNLYFERI